MYKTYSVLLLLLLSIANTFGQVDNCEQKSLQAFNPIPGTIPLSFGRVPSTDLLCDREQCSKDVVKGEVLTSKDAVEYYERMSVQTKCNWDLSYLEPQEIEDIWSNEVESSANDNDIDLNDLDEVEYVSDAAIGSGKFRMTVNKTNEFFTPIQYTLIISKSVHNYILRRNLLRKLGYKIPAIKYLKNLKINFDNKKMKTKFIEDLKLSGSGSLDRYIQSETSKYVVLQDIVAMEDQEFKLNLARGYISNDIFEGKRVYKSLLIPYALTEVPPSINMFGWTVGRIVSENVLLNYPEAKDYAMTKDDALWMTKRVLKLTSQDWWEIVNNIDLPGSVKLLLFEKLKSRRNHLASLFGVDNINLEVDTLITNAKDLKDGKILVPFYPGYARQFKIEDPDSPLSFSEMKAFIKSKAMSTGIELLVNAFNTSKFMGTDISGKVSDFNEKILAEAVATSMTENTVTKTPVKTYLFPTVKGNVIVNREIVAGSYLGTDNMISLVDTVGLSTSVGVFGGITGVYSKTGKLITTASGVVRQQIPVDLNASSSLFFNRTYSHVRNIETVQKALKYPFKNLFVPYLKRKYGHLIDELMDERYADLTIEQKINVNKMFVKNSNRIVQEAIASYNSLNESLKVESVLGQLNFASQKLNSLQVEFENAISPNEVTSEVLSELSSIVLSLNSVYDTDIKCLKTQSDKLCAYSQNGKLISQIDSLYTSSNQLEALSSRHGYKLNKNEEDVDLENISNLLDENIQIGESIIITDSLGASLGASAGVSLMNVFKVNLDLNSKKFVTGRLHFLRVSEDEVHVYRDLGNVNSIEATLGVRALIPIVKISLKATKGTGRTKFYKVKIGKMEDKFYNTVNVNRSSNLKALRSVLISGSTSALDAIKKPVVVTHKFTEKDPRIGVFVWRWNWLKQADTIEVTLPSGESKKMFKNQLGYTKGVDYENYFNDLVGLLTSKIFNTQYISTAFGAGNPGFTYMGKAKNRVLTYEGIFEDNTIKKPFVKLSHIVNGWKIKKDKALKVLKDLKEKYKYNFFEESVLAQTEEIFLYNINVNFFIYDTGIEFMLGLDDDKLKNIWSRFQTRNMKNYSGEDKLINSGISKYKRHKRKYLKFLAKNDLKKMSKHLMKMVEVVDDKLSATGILRVYGGSKNFIAVSKLDGFRIGDENGDKSIYSNSFGRKGEYQFEGPLGQLRKLLGITQGEFTMSWLLGRVI
jgi:hypothetical protein